MRKRIKLPQAVPGSDGHTHGPVVECGVWCPAWHPTQKCSGGMDARGMKTECSQPHMHKGPHDEAGARP